MTITTVLTKRFGLRVADELRRGARCVPAFCFNFASFGVAVWPFCRPLRSVFSLPSPYALGTAS
jgi:hypothetical protein